jgi:hypothetical protein
MVRSLIIVILVALSALPFVICLLLFAAVLFASRDAEKTNKKTISTLSASLPSVRAGLCCGSSRVSTARAYRSLSCGKQSKSRLPYKLRAVLGGAVPELSDNGTVLL